MLLIYNVLYLNLGGLGALFGGISPRKRLSFTMAQSSSHVTAPDQSKVVLQIRAVCKASSSILQ